MAHKNIEMTNIKQIVFIRAMPNRQGNLDIFECKFPLDSSLDRTNIVNIANPKDFRNRYVSFYFCVCICVSEIFSLFFIFSIYTLKVNQSEFVTGCS